MSDLAAAYTTLWASLTCREWREVIVKYELVSLLDENLVALLHVELCTEGYSRK